MTITPTNGTGGTDLLHRFRQEKFGSKSFSGNSSGAKLHKIIRNSTPSLADVQRKVAHKKLQMAKLMGHGGMAAPSVDFRKHQGHMMSDYHNDPLQVASRRARSNNFTLNETFALLKVEFVQFNINSTHLYQFQRLIFVVFLVIDMAIRSDAVANETQVTYSTNFKLILATSTKII